MSYLRLLFMIVASYIIMMQVDVVSFWLCVCVGIAVGVIHAMIELWLAEEVKE